MELDAAGLPPRAHEYAGAALGSRGCAGASDHSPVASPQAGHHGVSAAGAAGVAIIQRNIGSIEGQDFIGAGVISHIAHCEGHTSDGLT